MKSFIQRKHWLTLCSLVVVAMLSGCITTGGESDRPKPQPEKAARAYYDLGVAYIKKKRYDLAEIKLQRSIESSPTPEAYNALALMYELQHDNALAEETYQKLITKYPKYGRGYLNYNIFLCKYDRHAQIEQLASRMAAQGKEIAAIGQIAAGNCALEKKDINRAETHFKRALQYEQFAAGALLPLAEIDLERGDVAEANIKVNKVNNYIGYSARSVYLAILISRELGDEVRERKLTNVMRSRYAGTQEAKNLFGR